MGGDREVRELKGRLCAARLTDLDPEADLVQGSRGRNPALPDDVIEERQQVQGPRGEIGVRDEGDVVAAVAVVGLVVHIVRSAVQGDGGSIESSNECGVEEARIQVRWRHYLLCIYASGRYGQ